MVAEMPLPTVAVPLLQKPIGSMLMMHGFIREKVGREVGRKSEGDEVGPETTALQFSPVSLSGKIYLCISSEQQLKDKKTFDHLLTPN